MRLEEHKEKKCPKCGGSVTMRSVAMRLGGDADYSCDKCGTLLDMVW